MRRNTMLPPPVQQTFVFARKDVWNKLPVATQEECQRLLMQQLKQFLEAEHQQEESDERQDSI